MRRAALTPSRCPTTLGRPRRVAHRPLPSMMMATCSGSGCARMAARSAASSRSGAGAEPGDRSGVWGALIGLDGEDFLFLLLEQLVDPGDVSIGHLLDLVMRAALLVLCNLLVPGQ